MTRKALAQFGLVNQGSNARSECGCITWRIKKSGVAFGHDFDESAKT
jgi:hypothetical protein